MLTDIAMLGRSLIIIISQFFIGVHSLKLARALAHHIALTLNFHSQSIMPFCEANCGRWFKTAHRMHSHLSTAKSCIWYRKGKLRDIGITFQPAVEPGDLQQTAPLDWLEADVDEYDGNGPVGVLGDFDWDKQINDRHFISLQATSSAGPGPSSAINHIQRQAGVRQTHVVMEGDNDNDDDERIRDIHPTAGCVIQKEHPTPSLQDNKDINMSDGREDQEDVEMGSTDGRKSFFHPFESMMDWRIGRWFIQEGIGHNAIDRLLSIPGVRSYSLSEKTC